MKGTSEEGTRRGMDSGREEASGGGIERGMEGEQGSKGGKLQGKYPEEGTVRTVYSQTIPQCGPCHCYFVSKKLKIVNRYKL